MEIKVKGYTRVSTDKQELDLQIHRILKYADSLGYSLSYNDIYQDKISSRKSRKERGIDSVINELQEKDTLLVYALDRIGRSTIETLQIIEDIKEKGIILCIIKDNIVINPLDTNPVNEMMLTMLSAVAQLERTFISQRTKAALQAKKEQGIKLGRPKGSISKSIFDKDKSRILELKELGLSASKIQKHLGYGSVQGLLNFIKKIS